MLLEISLLKKPQDRSQLVYMTLCDITLPPQNKRVVTNFVGVKTGPNFCENDVSAYGIF